MTEATEEEIKTVGHLLMLLGAQRSQPQDNIYFGHLLVFLREQRATGRREGAEQMREAVLKMYCECWITEADIRALPLPGDKT
jgi:hypothetical protein